VRGPLIQFFYQYLKNIKLMEKFGKENRRDYEFNFSH